MSLAQQLCKGVGNQVRVRQLQGDRNKEMHKEIWEDLGAQPGVAPDLSNVQLRPTSEHSLLPPAAQGKNFSP